ncbi:pyridine nucleotide-disulfide oxidoreductase [Aeromicrobium sp. PE09-221]|uniref:NAD(P)/FAD-dependent oxidoreductase n=1 Tax=Aeromicrobium sp. PE09-221 TaxID=1898043 RepID=UPI000B3ED45E|nr:NAD(P)/FAD-dependent oxidoreductase [Aeromicrobium sp. PE09-221]OUZ11192.1 pyridine nucleotide-disulfide oxidoreductase [Aeromicrobium sp. PE09-221]
MFDVLVVGAGPAGLNAAMVLGRQRREVIVVDRGTPRNAPAEEMHMFLSRDGADPARLREIGRTELAAYPSVTLCEDTVTTITGEEGTFRAELAGGDVLDARRVLLATGLTDHLPDIPGLRERFGRTVRHCPFCHGWESRDQPLAVLGGSLVAALQARYIADRFSEDVVLVANGPLEVDDAVRRSLTDHGIHVEERPITRLDGDDDLRIVFSGGGVLGRAALFAFPSTTAQTDLGQRLGAEVLPDGCVAVDAFGRTGVPGVSAAGDGARSGELPGPAASVIAAAGSGATAAMWLEQELFRIDLDLPLPT